MAFVDFASREIHCKIVYYGPGLCGKTKNLQTLHARSVPSRRGQLISLATPNERTLFFDFLPLDVGSLRGFQTRLHLYTVPGQVFYDAARRAILRGTDGIVLVADSQEARLAANVESVRNLEKNLREQDIEIAEVPYVLQLNKRDLPSALPADELRRLLAIKDEPTFEATATTGAGVFETLKGIAREVLLDLRKRKTPGSFRPASAAR
jgi:signal recognition particle receptor subunit beta